jgi:diguanylate cyclase (GGDEF)-like protein
VELDTRTTVVASLLVAALLGGVALVFARGQRDPGPLALWGAALLMLSAGFTGVALRGRAPDFLTVVVANTLIVAALVVSYRSLVSFRRPPTADVVGWSLVGAVFVALWALSELWPDLNARIAVLSIVRTCLFARNALELGRDVPAECRLSFGFTRWVFWFAALAMVIRAIAALSQTPQADFMEPNPVHAVPYLAFAGVAVAATLGVFWVVVQLLQRELVRLAHHDGLTGIFNRPAFLAEFEREASRSRRGGERFSLAMFDLDRFKDLNDRFGHAAGDEVLRLAAATMRDCLRRHDVLGRYGGEEFALLMPAADKDTALRIAERVRAAVEALAYSRGAERVTLSVSGGVATQGDDGGSWEELFAAADRALYAAKNAGRNRVLSAVS